ncbi:HIRA-interacting protein 3 isoform X2 [Gymnodraco acuticeps]|uniref:HIRA-interacting protein 3 isoform X2 n=1 Tax=Gymnodraco acuticeps TaxID=8218 RepID=A0A6P8TX42_GYMAC|nr:HIRA-interacting protein 3 isoform X2 [Gymnodraco acuticeps]
MDMSEKEKTGISRFVCDQLRDEPDLSTLTLRILRKRYLERAQCDSLSPEVKHFIKRVVEEALIKMQENDENDGELETKNSQNKRKREDEVLSGGEDEDVSTAKKLRRRSSPSSESEVKKDCKTGSDDSEEEEKVKSEDEKKEVKKSQRTTNGKSKPQISSEESSDEEMNESENKSKESSCEDSPKEKAIKKTDATKNGESGSSDASKGKKTPQSDEEDKPDTESESEESEQMKDKDPSDDSEKEKVLVEKKNNDSDSSLTSLDEEQNNGKENTAAGKKKKATKKVEKKEKSASGPKGDNTSVVRLKRYITLCGVRLNYKKVLQDCHSVRSQVAVLKKQLEDLGVDGQPSIKKCRKIKMKREETQELADLDVSNIIVTEGRPKRRGTSAGKEWQDSPSSTYLRTVNSGSDSDEENKPNRGRKRLWANLQGIISDDADSN